MLVDAGVGEGSSEVERATLCGRGEIVKKMSNPMYNLYIFLFSDVSRAISLHAA